MADLHLHNEQFSSLEQEDLRARHALDSGPLKETADVLRRTSVTPSLDPDTKSHQRAHLMSLSSSSSAPVPPPVAPANPLVRRPWFAWAGGFVAVAAVAILAVSVAKYLPGGLRTLTPGRMEFGQILIPAARAADAFNLYPEKADKAGMDADSAFIVQTKVALTTAQLKQTVRVVPAIDFTVEAKDDHTFRVLPTQPLKPGTVYSVAVAAKVENTDGSTQLRQFSWALQTKNDLRVLSTIPGDQASGVPTNTGIEFKFTYADVADLAPYFSISPAVAGTFEAHGRSIAFVPKEALQPGTTYQVMLKKGVRVKESGLALGEDTVIRFETYLPPKTEEMALRFMPNEFEEAAPGEDILVTNSYGYDQRLTSSTIEVTGFALSPEETRTLLQGRLAIPFWAPVASGEYVDYKNVAKNQAFHLSVTPVQEYNYGSFHLTLPKIDRPGQYAIRFLPKDKNGQESWMLLQVTNNAVYSLGDKEGLALWVVNASAQRALSNLPIRVVTSSFKTDEGGVVRLPLSVFATSTNSSTSSQNYLMAEIGEAPDVYFFFKSRFSGGISPYGWGSPQMYDNWAYLFIDRPLYRPTDDLAMYGFIQDRTSHQGVGSVTLKLQKSGSYWSDFFGREKVYQEQVVQTDVAGHLQGTFHWSDLTPGYYQVNAYVHDQLVTSRFFEVRDFVKPAFSIDVKTEADRVYAGDAIKGTVLAQFYDGTPLPKGTFEIQMSSPASPVVTQQLTTDESGRANFSLPTQRLDCDLNSSQGSCALEDYKNITVRSTQGEEADIVGSASVDVFGSALSIDLMPRTSGTDARISIASRHVDFSKPDFSGDPWGGRSLKGFVIGHSWKQIPDGVYYDFFEKKTVTRYRYEQINDVPQNIQIVTDATGRASYGFKMEDKKWYDVTVTGTDDQGRGLRVSRSVAMGWYDRFEDIERFYAPEQPTEDTSPYLAFVPDNQDRWSPGTFNQDDLVTVQFQHGKQKVETGRAAGTLFVTASRGIRTIQHQDGPTYQFRFDQNLIPNATIRAVSFVNHHFEVARRDLGLNLDRRKLDVVATSTQKTYLPGGDVRIHVVVTKKGTTDRAARAKIAFAAVDKSLEGVTYFTDEMPVDLLYGYVPDGILSEGSSHEPGGQMLSSAGAEKGGGGGGPDAKNVRRSFKDTASAGLVETDQNGEADIVFKAPDNLTTWRVQLVAITSDVMAGAKVVQVPVTKSLFVDVVAPPQLLTKDKPVLKLRAYGVGLQNADPITFTVDAPTLGVQNQVVSGHAFESLYIALDKLIPGRHVVTVRVTTAKGTDALERILDIADTHYLKDEQVVVEGVPTATLPDLGASEVELTFASKAQASLLPEIRGLSYMDWSARVDAKVVARMMRRLLKEVYKETPDELTQEQSLQMYLDPEGGVRLLPYSSADGELTAEVAATAPELFDQGAMKGYFYKVLDDTTSIREVQIGALAGLAALREPVLLQLQAMASQSDLSWRERLVIARGLMAAGDQEGARAQLNALLAKAQHRDNVESLNVSEKQADIYEATADAAALAAQLAHPDAENLARYVRENWSRDAFPLLAKARYLARVAPLSPVNKVTMDYSVDGKTERHVDLTEYPVDTVRLTQAEVRSFRVLRVQGPLSVSYVKRVAGRPENQQEVAVARSYKADRPLDQLQEGDMVRVTLKAEWTDKAQDGCYALRDHLPGGWQPVLNLAGAIGMDTLSYPYDVKDREVSYVVCKYDKMREVTYLARIVSRGTYTAEAPSLQHLQFPAVSAIGNDQIVTIK